MVIPGGTAVIRGFNFDFKSADHHIKDFGVMLNGSGGLEVYYGDKNRDDSFDWQVQYAILAGRARSPVLDPGQSVLTPVPD